MQPEDLIPRKVCILSIQLDAVLDLRKHENLFAVGLTRDDIASDDMSRCREVGEAAHKLNLEGVLAPSATSEGEVLAILELNLRAESIVREAETFLWTALP
jgi:RES domain-containing protein